MANIFIESLWRSLNREAVCLEKLTEGFKAHRAIRYRMAFHNIEHPDFAPGRRTPGEAYRAGRDEKPAA